MAKRRKEVLTLLHRQTGPTTPRAANPNAVMQSPLPKIKSLQQAMQIVRSQGLVANQKGEGDGDS